MTNNDANSAKLQIFCLENTIRGGAESILRGFRVGLLRHCSYFVILWCAGPYLDKIVWHYLLSRLVAK